ncbi:MAG: hypothetical protein ACRC10_11560 [Thermoguttaceae bacterium]
MSLKTQDGLRFSNRNRPEIGGVVQTQVTCQETARPSRPDSE